MLGKGEWLEAVDREVSKCGEVAGGGAVLGHARGVDEADRGADGGISRGGSVSREGECSAATAGRCRR